MKRFTLQSNASGSSWRRSALLTVALALVLGGGCSRAVRLFGKSHDLTEDLHHRLQAGLWKPNNTPMILQMYRRSKLAPYAPARFTWERGTFSVKADDHALLVFYMDSEATYSHLSVAGLKGYGVARQFRVLDGHPIR